MQSKGNPIFILPGTTIRVKYKILDTTVALSFNEIKDATADFISTPFGHLIVPKIAITSST